jgi:GH15 family glucan-1,4-alpha-glucosidase
MYKKISDYAIIGNLHSAALISTDGSIDWLCLPHIDSPSVFAALLDDVKGGLFAVRPVDKYDSSSAYLKNTNILVTSFRTKKGITELTDFMPVPCCGHDERDEESHILYRLAEVKEGEMEMHLEFLPRFDYARERPSFEKRGEVIIASGVSATLFLSASRPIGVFDSRAEARWKMKKGERIWIRMEYGETDDPELSTENAERALRNTGTYWKSWLEKSETGVTVELGPFEDMVNRSALALKLLYYSPEGTIAAAATTSLPEEIGGVRNWDYRFTWLRDTSFILRALFHLGHISEMEGYLRWIEKIISQHGAERLQIMYGLRGEEDLHEHELDHLSGYRDSKPVRIGNSAAQQKQLDIYGEVMDAALQLSDYVGKIDRTMWPFLESICDHVLSHWQEPDNGIWEVRGGPYHFVYSKLMCWVALDRGITIAKRYGFSAALKSWEEGRELIRKEILEKGFSKKRNAFVQHYDTDALDASNLLIPIMGFLPYNDQRVISTVQAVQEELGQDGLFFRYTADDSLPGKEGRFLLCSFWFIDNLTSLGRLQEAEMFLKKMEGIANHAGLFPEEYDPVAMEHLGNFPQAFTHIGYINSVIALSRATGLRIEDHIKGIGQSIAKRLFGTILLNEGKPDKKLPSRQVISDIKKSMNVLRGAFFNTKEGRVAYELMHQSKAYRSYVELTSSLKNVGLADLETSEERLAFWINLFNVIVIHGVIELGIRDSVKEVRNFFRKIQYNVGDMHFSPDDIEHGILRGNRRPPNSLFRRFHENDVRKKLSINTVDPRIHFALVCASSSCPPIEVYTAEMIDSELNIAAESFLNSGGIVLDTVNNEVSLSRIFKWYGHDFGHTVEERLAFAAGYLYNHEERDFLKSNAGSIKVRYQEYDWRLNRD